MPTWFIAISNPTKGIYVRVAVLGASGHGRVVAECALAQGGLTVVGFAEISPDKNGAHALGLPIYGPQTPLASLTVEGVLLGVGNNLRRLTLLESTRREGFLLPIVTHPRSWVAASALLGEGAVVMANATVQTACRIGAAVIVNTNASVDHDCVLADGVHISPGAHLAGGVAVGEGTHIGIGATVIEGIRIGANCLIAAGAVVVRDVPDGQRVAGVPARPMRRQEQG